LRRPDLGGVASGRNALGAERERPYLRDARRRPRPRLRPFVDRRVAHRVLDARTLPLARVDGLVCVLGAGRVFFGSYNGVFYGVSASRGSVLWRVGTGGPISGAAVVVDGVGYAGSFSGRIVGVAATSGRVVLNFHHGHYVPVSGDG